MSRTRFVFRRSHQEYVSVLSKMKYSIYKYAFFFLLRLRIFHSFLLLSTANFLPWRIRWQACGDRNFYSQARGEKIKPNSDYTTPLTDPQVANFSQREIALLKKVIGNPISVYCSKRFDVPPSAISSILPPKRGKDSSLLYLNAVTNFLIIIDISPSIVSPIFLMVFRESHGISLFLYKLTWASCPSTNPFESSTFDKHFSKAKQGEEGRRKHSEMCWKFVPSSDGGKSVEFRVMEWTRL